MPNIIIRPDADSARRAINQRPTIIITDPPAESFTPFFFLFYSAADRPIRTAAVIIFFVLLLLLFIFSPSVLLSLRRDVECTVNALRTRTVTGGRPEGETGRPGDPLGRARPRSAAADPTRHVPGPGLSQPRAVYIPARTDAPITVVPQQHT